MPDISKIKPHVGVAQETSKVREQVDPRMMEAAKSFENQFLRFMIKEMRKAPQGDGLVPESMGEGIFKEELDNNYVDTWVDQGGVGLSQVIYDNLVERYGPQKTLPKSKSEFLPTSDIRTAPTKQNAQKFSDILSRQDGGLFLAKKLENGFHLKSKNPLSERVSVLAPHSGLVLQAASLEDGRQSLKLSQDEGLVTEIVHSGKNLVSAGMRVAAGSSIAELPQARQGENANLLLRLRRQVANE